MRNLQIEVRQVRGNSASRNTLDAAGTVRMQPGHSGGQVHLEAQSGQRTESGDVTQRLLVLNGRSANILATDEFTVHTSDYALVDLGLSYRVNHNVSVVGRIRNATDKRYAANVSSTMAYLGAPRTADVSVRVAF